MPARAEDRDLHDARAASAIGRDVGRAPTSPSVKSARVGRGAAAGAAGRRARRRARRRRRGGTSARRVAGDLARRAGVSAAMTGVPACSASSDGEAEALVAARVDERGGVACSSASSPASGRSTTRDAGCRRACALPARTSGSGSRGVASGSARGRRAASGGPCAARRRRRRGSGAARRARRRRAPGPGRAARRRRARRPSARAARAPSPRSRATTASARRAARRCARARVRGEARVERVGQRLEGEVVDGDDLRARRAGDVRGQRVVDDVGAGLARAAAQLDLRPARRPRRGCARCRARRRRRPPRSLAASTTSTPSSRSAAASRST